IVEGSSQGSEVEVSLPPPHFAWDEVPLTYPMDTAHLPLSWGPLEHPMALNVGNPHLVFFVPDEQATMLVSVGPSIEHDPAFPERINVNVASVRDGGIHLRTWERGAGMTLACGTGACATAVAAIVQKKASSPVRVHMRGGELTVTWAPGEPIRMRGTATHAFQLELHLAQLA